MKSHINRPVHLDIKNTISSFNFHNIVFSIKALSLSDRLKILFHRNISFRFNEYDLYRISHSVDFNLIKDDIESIEKIDEESKCIKE